MKNTLVAKRTKPHASYTTLRACLVEKKITNLSKEKIIEIGKVIADNHYTVYQNRPRKIEVVEKDRIVFVAAYPAKFKKVIFNILSAYEVQH